MRFKKHQIIEISELTDASYVWEVLQIKPPLDLYIRPRTWPTVREAQGFFNHFPVVDVSSGPKGWT